jgi:hypothetical protein
VRRSAELVSDLWLVAGTARLEGGPAVLEVGENTAIFLTDRKRFDAMLLMATGSESHVHALEAVAKQ